jgi:hypothetical protein
MEKKYFLYALFFLFGLSATISSCSLFTPPAIIPCYGHIDSIPLIITNPGVQGTSANGINCAWVYVDNNPVGAFPLPCTFPMIATTGKHNVVIFAGIEDNGSAGSRMKYPFYSAYTLTGTQLTQGATVKFKPTVNYAAWSYVSIVSDYEGLTNGFQNVIVDTNDTSMAIIHKPNPNVYQGNGSGYIALTANRYHYRGITDTFSLVSNGNAIFLEINYKTNNIFTVGMENMYSGQYIPIVYVDTSSTWKKMYINLQPTVASYASPTNAGYKIYIDAQLDSDVTLGQIYIDNIKLVRYN